jgi:hypothetical protein
LHTEELKKEWEKWGMGIPLKIIESPYRSITTPLVGYINREAEKHEDSITTVGVTGIHPARVVAAPVA